MYFKRLIQSILLLKAYFNKFFMFELRYFIKSNIIFFYFSLKFIRKTRFQYYWQFRSRQYRFKLNPKEFTKRRSTYTKFLKSNVRKGFKNPSVTYKERFFHKQTLVKYLFEKSAFYALYTVQRYDCWLRNQIISLKIANFTVGIQKSLWFNTYVLNHKDFCIPTVKLAIFKEIIWLHKHQLYGKTVYNALNADQTNRALVLKYFYTGLNLVLQMQKSLMYFYFKGDDSSYIFPDVKPRYLKYINSIFIPTNDIGGKNASVILAVKKMFFGLKTKDFGYYIYF